MTPLASGSSSSEHQDNEGHHEDFDNAQDEDRGSPNLSPVLQELAMVTEKVNVLVHFALILLFHSIQLIVDVPISGVECRYSKPNPGS